jgi:hypothetical protein
LRLRFFEDLGRKNSWLLNLDAIEGNDLQLHCICCWSSGKFLFALVLSIPFHLPFAPGTPIQISPWERQAVFAETIHAGWIWHCLAFLIQLQISAVLFNLLPLPPLDGYGILNPWLCKCLFSKRNVASSIAKPILQFRLQSSPMDDLGTRQRLGLSQVSQFCLKLR